MSRTCKHVVKNDGRRVVVESEFIFTWQGIASELGCSSSTLRAWCTRGNIRLAKWGNGRTSPVYVGRCHIYTIKHRLLCLPGTNRFDFNAHAGYKELLTLVTGC